MKLFDLLGLHEPAVTPTSAKVHLATYNGHEQPFDVYRQGGFEEWQRRQSKRAFETIRSLAGRAVVHYPRTGRQSVRRGDVVSEQLKIIAIREQPLLVERFRAYSEVCLSKIELDKIVQLDDASWHAALSAVSGVYVITDKSNGKLYVGSAAGGGGLWRRWRDYSETGHGNNDKLKELLEREGPNRASSFQFGILEIADKYAPLEEVLHRERHWKRALQSRMHGYNLNL